MEEIIELSKIIVAPICVLLAAFIGSYFTALNARYLKRHELLLRQIDEFYAPILGSWLDIDSKVQLKLELDEEFKAAWEEICERNRNNMDWDHGKAFEKFMNNIMFHNEQFRGEMLPFFQKILEIYRNKIWLLNLNDRKQLRGAYYKLHTFLEIWKMVNKEAFPREVSERIKHGIGDVRPFILKIEEQRERIILEVSKGSRFFKIKNYLYSKIRMKKQLKYGGPLSLE